MARRDAKPSKASGRGAPAESLVLHGHHAVRAALANPARRNRKLLATRNALRRLQEDGFASDSAPRDLEIVLCEPREIDRAAGASAVHQGLALLTAPLPEPDIEDVTGARLLVALDQVTDPHNVGAILRSAAAFGAGGVIVTERHAPQETATLAKAASGALEHVPVVKVVNLARALDELRQAGFLRLGLDSEAGETLGAVGGDGRIALVLGAEGKGLRRLTRERCDLLARLPTSGPIASLNVSNAAAVALYAVRRS